MQRSAAIDALEMSLRNIERSTVELMMAMRGRIAGDSEDANDLGSQQADARNSQRLSNVADLETTGDQESFLTSIGTDEFYGPVLRIAVSCQRAREALEDLKA